MTSERHARGGVDLAWVRSMIIRFGLPVWFFVNAAPAIAVGLRDTSLLYFDARLYLMATRVWLEGGDPWAVELAGNHFAAPPISMLPLAPLASLPFDIGVAIVASACFLSALATVRLLHLPWWWLMFPPLVQCLLSANVHAALVPLILSGAGWLATLLKVYAALPLVILGRWRSLAIACGLILLTLPVLPWATYVEQFGTIADRLALQTKHDIPLPVLFAISPAVGLGLLLIGRDRAAWLAPLALWPSQQYYYGTLVMPTYSALAAAVIALPITGSGIIAVAILAAMEWRKGQRLSWRRSPRQRLGPSVR